METFTLTHGKDRDTVAESLVEARLYTRFVVLHLPGWRTYLAKNADSLSQRSRKLKEGLDELSQAAVDRYLRYYELMLSIEKTTGKRLHRYDLLLDREFLLGEEERAWKNRIESSYGTLSDRFVFPEHLLTSVDAVQMGLAFGLKTIPDAFVDLRGKDVIDGGGFCGDSALSFCNYSPRMVYAFEPHPQTFEMMQNVLRMNGGEHLVRPVSSGLGRTTGTFSLFGLSGTDSSSGFRFQEERSTVDVPCTTIDDYVLEHRLEPGLIKLDVEGSEQDVMIGAAETIRRFEPILLISIYHRAADFFEIKPFLEHLCPRYRFLLRQTSFKWPNNELCLIAYTESS